MTEHLEIAKKHIAASAAARAAAEQHIAAARDAVAAAREEKAAERDRYVNACSDSERPADVAAAEECGPGQVNGPYVPTPEDRRNSALHHAVQSLGGSGSDVVVQAARDFESFLAGEHLQPPRPLSIPIWQLREAAEICEYGAQILLSRTGVIVTFGAGVMARIAVASYEALAQGDRTVADLVRKAQGT